ncbi:unnamed protein product, partial [Didymodactylos carnosus]
MITSFINSHCGIKYFKQKCLTIIDNKLDLTNIHYAAAILDPTIRQLKGCTAGEQARRRKFLKRRLDKMTNQQLASLIISDVDDEQNSDDEYYLNRYSDQHSCGRKNKKDELSKYLKYDHPDVDKNIYTKPISLNNKKIKVCDPLLFWNEISNTFPLLAKVAEQILAIPPTSGSVERSFCGVDLTITELRTNINPDTFNDC